MFTNLLKSFKNFKMKSSSHILLIYNCVNIAIASTFFPLIPILLNYPPGAIGARRLGISYAQQYVVIVTIIILISSYVLREALKSIDEWDSLKADGEPQHAKIQLIRKKCLNIPYTIFLLQIIIPVLVILIVSLLVKMPLMVAIKIAIIIATFTTLGAIISFVFSKKIFSSILSNTYHRDNLEGLRIGLKSKIFLQIIPMFIVAILFTSLIGYSRLIDEKGDWIFKVYKKSLAENFSSLAEVKTIDQLKKRLALIKSEEINLTKFIINPNGSCITLDGSTLDKFFLTYLRDLSPRYNERVYSGTGEVQGVVYRIKSTTGDWVVGVKYNVALYHTVIFFIGSFFILLVFNLLVLSYFSTALAQDISLVSNSLTQIAAGENVDLDKKLPVTSNDEIGDLVIAFNKILDLEKENIRQIRERQEMLIERERLATLGQLIGGIAHNLKTPIMSLAGGTEALKDLINEYQESVDDKNVTPVDHQQIAAEMLTWIEEMKSYCAYMSDVITTVREQAVQMTVSSDYGFTIEELVKRIELLLKYELKKYQCKMKLDIQVSKRTRLTGDITNLIQVLNNIILNAIHAYDDQGGKIELRVSGGDSYLEFTIRDYGKGIPKAIQPRLFKEMITTKGTKGTGLGLYMSHLTIKGKFGGNLWFESAEGQGTTFYINIPVLNGLQSKQSREEVSNAQG